MCRMKIIKCDHSNPSSMLLLTLPSPQRGYSHYIFHSCYYFLLTCLRQQRQQYQTITRDRALQWWCCCRLPMCYAGVTKGIVTYCNRAAIHHTSHAPAPSITITITNQLRQPTQQHLHTSTSNWLLCETPFYSLATLSSRLVGFVPRSLHSSSYSFAYTDDTVTAFHHTIRHNNEAHHCSGNNTCDHRQLNKENCFQK